MQSSADLKDLNKELNATEGEINGLWKDYYDNIKKIGYSYANT